MRTDGVTSPADGYRRRMPSPSDAETPPTHAHALPDGRTLAYVVAGDPDGAPVVAHHGTPGSRLFAGLLADAARDVGVRLLVPDRPGYGRSDAPPDGWTWHDWRADLDSLLADESVEAAGALGFSGGGPFALAAATSRRVTRVGLVGAVVPPSEGGLASLARAPFALRALFRVSDLLVRAVGPRVVVRQYTDRDVPDPVAARVAADFREALRPGARTPVRESRLFASESVGSVPSEVSVRAWHGVRDGNAPLDPVRAFVRDAGGEVTTLDADHLGTLLDCRRDALSWLAAGR